MLGRTTSWVRNWGCGVFAVFLSVLMQLSGVDLQRGTAFSHIGFASISVVNRPDPTRPAPGRVWFGSNTTGCENCVESSLHDYPRGQEKVLERKGPNTFRNTMKRVLPMILRLSYGKDRTLWASFSKEYYDFRDSAEKAVSDVYHYATSRRSNFWTIRYGGLHSRLELNLASKVPRWYLHVKVGSDLSRNDRSREVAASLIARMDFFGQDFLRGTWHLCVPGPLMPKV
jgi:hypothetical protein